MEERTNKQKMENYINKSKLLGSLNFSFEYYENGDRVYITDIFEADVVNNNMLKIPNFVSRINYYAWAENEYLRDKEIYIPKGCIIEFSESGESNKFESFSDHVKNIIVQEEHEEYCSEDGVLFDKKKTVLLAYPRCKEDKEYRVPSSVVQIQQGAFFYSDNLEKLFISKNIVDIGECFFKKNTNVLVDKANTSYKSVRGSLYSKDGKVLYHICVPKDNRIIIEEGTVIVKNGFVDAYVDELYIPSTLKPIGDFGMLIDRFNDYEVIKAPKKLKKYLRKREKDSDVIYY